MSECGELSSDVLGVSSRIDLGVFDRRGTWPSHMMASQITLDSGLPEDLLWVSRRSGLAMGEFFLNRLKRCRPKRTG